MSKPTTQTFLSKHKTALACAIVLILTIAGIATAAVVLKNPVAENVIDTPIDPTPSPAPSPTTPPTMPTAIHLTSNLTVGSFHKGDTLQLVATVNQPVAGLTVTLYNKGSIVNEAPTAYTNSAGVAVFNRQPTQTFNYSVAVTVP